LGYRQQEDRWRQKARRWSEKNHRPKIGARSIILARRLCYQGSVILAVQTLRRRIRDARNPRVARRNFITTKSGFGCQV
jgi:hypothetical protein